MPLRRLDEDLYAVDVDLHQTGLHLRLRMVVVRLDDGTLWLHSPVPIDDEVADAIGALGEVAHLVAPNRNHHLHFAAAQARYPSATTWGAPGLREKKPALGLARVVDTGSTFGSTIEARRIEGVPLNDEVVFHHVPTRTLICTDFVLHVVEEPSFLTRQLYKAIAAYGGVAQNRLWRRRTTDRAASRAAVDDVLAWGFTRVVMAHGDVIEEDALERIREATAWLDDR